MVDDMFYIYLRVRAGRADREEHSPRLVDRVVDSVVDHMG